MLRRLSILAPHAGATLRNWNSEPFEPIPDHTPAGYGLRLKNGTVEGIQSQSGNTPGAEWDTVFVWDLATGIVTHYLPGDPAGPSFEPEPLPDARRCTRRSTRTTPGTAASRSRE